MTTKTTATSAPILVIGATGRHGGTGHHLVRRLRESGQPVRILVRRLDERVARLEELGAKVIVGDLHDRASLIHALEGIEAAYFTYPINAGIVDAAANFAAAARHLGGHQRVVVMSMAASHPESPSHLGRAQWLAEEVLSWAGLDCLVLRIAALFHENLTMLHAGSIRDRDEIRNSFGNAAIPWLGGEDAAEIAAAALLHSERFEGGTIRYIPGAEILSHAEIAALLSEELGRPIRFESLTRDAWRSEILELAALEPYGAVNTDMAGHISAVGAMMAAAGRHPVQEPGAGELHRLTGRSPTLFRTFLRRERERFGAVSRTEPGSGLVTQPQGRAL